MESKHMEDTDPDPILLCPSDLSRAMETLASNGHTEADEVGKFGVPEACQVDTGMTTARSPSNADNSISVDSKEEVLKVKMKKRAFDEGSKDLQSPSKKLNLRSLSDAQVAEVDPALSNSCLADAMVIDTAWEETGERESDNQPNLSSFGQVSGTITSCTNMPNAVLESGNHVKSEASRICEVAQGASDTDRIQTTVTSVGCNMDTVKSEGDSNAIKSAAVEVKNMGGSNVVGDSLESVVVETKDDSLMSYEVRRNGRLDFESDEQVLSNVLVGERSGLVMGTEASVPHNVRNGDSLCSTPNGVDSQKIEGDSIVAGASPTSADEVSVSRAQRTPLSFGSHTADVIEGKDGLVVLGDSLQCESTVEEGVDNESGISDVDEMQIGKIDTAKALELKMVEVIMQAPGFEVAESRVDETLIPSSNHLVSVHDQVGGNTSKRIVMNGFSDEDNLTEQLLEPVVKLPEHPQGTNALMAGTLDAEEPSNGQVANDLHLKRQVHLNEHRWPRQGLRDPFGGRGPNDKDLDRPCQPGSDQREDSMDRQDPEVATPSAATSAQSQSSGLKLRLKLKGPVDFPLKEAIGRDSRVKEVLLKEAPGSAKLLLASGLLDGHQVRYMGRGGHVMLTGIIQDGGVLCDCSTCKGLQVVNVSAFEKHAGSSARHPSDFIFLENGKCLKDILEIGWNANKHKLNALEVLKAAIGEVGDDNTIKRGCCKCGLREGELLPCIRPRCSNVCHPGCCGVSEGDWLCFNCEKLEKKPKPSPDTKPRLPLDTKPRSSVELKSRGTEGRAALSRDRGTKEKEPVGSPSLSRETSGANLHKALFLPGGLADDTELGYYVKGQKFLAGVKKGAGICCSCCQQVISCSLFEQHAGWGSRRNPYTSIYLSDGRSLHDAAQSLVVEQTVKQEGTTPTKIEHLEQCVECGDRGDLLLCNGCPNVYHQDCLAAGDAPPGEIFCPDCQEQRFGGIKDRRRSMVKRRSKGNAKTLLTKDRVTGRCTRLLQVPEAIILGGCVFCKSGDFAKSGFGPMTTLLCDQCEREYHVGCLKKHGLEDLKELPEGEWFCGQDCKHIHSILSLLVANGPEPLADSIISKVLKIQPQNGRSDEVAESSSGEFEWQLLHGRGGDPANGKTLAEAVQIFSECFDPIVDGTSGGDLIPLMVYRRSIRDQEFGGIYCVVVKENNKVVSTALIRVFGRQLAELPLLATSPSHQGQGHCKALLLSIERLLGVLRVERLALPAAEGAEGIWLNKFGFTRMPEAQIVLGNVYFEQMTQFHADLNMMIFTGSSMLEKEIAPLEIKKLLH